MPRPAAEFKADTVREGNTVVSVLSGDLHDGTRELSRRALEGALDARPALLAVDLGAVELFTAAGLNLLLTLRETARTREVPLALISPSASVRRVLDLTGVAAGTFSIHSTMREAAH
ncbi:STAS domain-containing protein [Streptomyces sp. NPDC127112]|uniref:STAS domain-containing protein n=1 Tax=Streptomyces sp. NPDC127112 TaxID=3345364 RepID=UPI003633F321